MVRKKKNEKKMDKGIKIKYIPYEVLKKDKDFECLFEPLKESYLIIIDAKIKPEEEAKIIEKTMENINLKFKGIEISAIDFENVDASFQQGIKGIFSKISEKVVGRRKGITLIGPADVIKAMEKDPDALFIHLK